jgi:hypothetical protein
LHFNYRGRGHVGRTVADTEHVTSRIPRQSVQSSAIAKVGYSKRRHILEIEFVNGAVYRYLDVPVTVYRDLMSAESKARFYDSNIRKHYRSVLVRPRQKQRAANGLLITQKRPSHQFASFTRQVLLELISQIALSC